MIYENAARFLKLPKLEEVEITDDARLAFVNAVVTNSPFYQEVELNNIKIVFASPSIEQKEDVSNDELLLDCLQGIEVQGKTIYKKTGMVSVEDVNKQLLNAINRSVIIYIVVDQFHRFMLLFRKLLMEARNPDFFLNTNS